MKKSNRIEHFDDLCLLLSKEEIQEACLSLLYNEEIYEKIDGCPNIFFGLTGINGDTPLIATKSIFNVNPKFYISKEDIQADKKLNPKLAEKLLFYFTQIFESECRFNLRPSIIISAEVVLDPFMISEVISETRNFSGYQSTPNIIHYYSGFQKPHNKFSIMPTAAYDIDELSTKSLLELRAFLNENPNNQTIRPLRLHRFRDYNLQGVNASAYEMLFQELIDIPCDKAGYTFITAKAGFDDIKKFINSFLRDPQCESNWTDKLPDEYNGICLHNFKVVSKFKDMLIRCSNCPEMEGLIANIRGTVLTNLRYKLADMNLIPYYEIKLVDRYQFSRRNFDKTIVRSWT